MGLWFNPDILITQRLLSAPNYAGPGRWIAFEPLSKSSFLLTGPDVVPDIVEIMLRAGEHGGRVDRCELTDLPSFHGHKTLEELIQKGLLIQEPCPGRPFVELYQTWLKTIPCMTTAKPDGRPVTRPKCCAMPLKPRHPLAVQLGARERSFSQVARHRTKTHYDGWSSLFLKDCRRFCILQLGFWAISSGPWDSCIIAQARQEERVIPRTSTWELQRLSPASRQASTHTSRKNTYCS